MTHQSLLIFIWTFCQIFVIRLTPTSGPSHFAETASFDEKFAIKKRANICYPFQVHFIIAITFWGSHKINKKKRLSNSTESISQEAFHLPHRIIIFTLQESRLKMGRVCRSPVATGRGQLLSKKLFWCRRSSFFAHAREWSRVLTLVYNNDVIILVPRALTIEPSESASARMSDLNSYSYS